MLTGSRKVLKTAVLALSLALTCVRLWEYMFTYSVTLQWVQRCSLWCPYIVCMYKALYGCMSVMTSHAQSGSLLASLLLTCRLRPFLCWSRPCLGYNTCWYYVIVPFFICYHTIQLPFYLLECGPGISVFIPAIHHHGVAAAKIQTNLWIQKYKPIIYCWLCDSVYVLQGSSLHLIWAAFGAFQPIACQYSVWYGIEDNVRIWQFTCIVKWGTIGCTNKYDTHPRYDHTSA